MTQTNTVEEIVSQPYKYGFTTEIETEKIPKGLNENVIRLISAKKNEPDFLLKFRLRAYEQWLKMKEPDWSGLNYSKVNPLKPSCKINNQEINKIILYTKKVLKRAIRKGGSSINNFQSISGDQGSFQNEFRAYNRENENCKNKLFN